MDETNISACFLTTLHIYSKCRANLACELEHVEQVKM